MSVSDSPSKTEPDKGVVGRSKFWGSVPFRNPDFVSRGELLEKLHQDMLEPSTTATAVRPEALYGTGGVGNSQTVFEYIHRRSAEYDTTSWVASEQLVQTTAWFDAHRIAHYPPARWFVVSHMGTREVECVAGGVVASAGR